MSWKHTTSNENGLFSGEHDMETDIKLDQGNDGTQVLIEGQVLKVTASDLLLDNAARRKNQRGLRRALVHNQQDGLTINYNRDYPGGVTINDVVALNNRHGFSIHDLREIHGYPLQTQHTIGTDEAQRSSLIIRGDIMIEQYLPATAVAQTTASAQEDGHAHQQHVEHLRNEAALAERRFKQVDPDNRLVAAELEKRWEEALAELKRATGGYAGGEVPAGQTETVSLQRTLRDLQDQVTRLTERLAQIEQAAS
jgi:hypothetical protein